MNQSRYTSKAAYPTPKNNHIQLSLWQQDQKLFGKVLIILRQFRELSLK
jgi:hypothetical protein